MRKILKIKSIFVFFVLKLGFAWTKNEWNERKTTEAQFFHPTEWNTHIISTKTKKKYFQLHHRTKKNTHSKARPLFIAHNCFRSIKTETHFELPSSVFWMDFCYRLENWLHSSLAMALIWMLPTHWNIYVVYAI